MPLADPTVNFEVAARHLARHLNEPSRLRANPLVRRFFETQGGAGRNRASDEAAAATIRSVVEQRAARYSHKDVASVIGPEVARRRYAIATAHLLGAKPLRDVADALGISMRQGYRERLAVINDVATHVGAYDVSPPCAAQFVISEARALMKRADCYVDLGDLDRALWCYDEIIRSGETADITTQALCSRAGALLRQGQYAASEASLEQARLSSAHSRADGASGSAAAALVALSEAKLYWAMGRYAEDAAALERALVCITPALAGRGEQVAKVYAAIQLEFCERHRVRGNFSAAHGRVLEAEAAVSWFDAPAATHFGVMMMSWRLGGKSSEFQGVTTRRMNRYEALTKLALFAESSTSPAPCVDLAHAFMQYYADSGNSAEALNWAHRALQLARRHSDPQLNAQASLTVADWLSFTSQWKSCIPLLKAADDILYAGSADWIFLQGLWSSLALIAGRYREAMQRANVALEGTERMQSDRFGAAARTTIALAANALGHKSEATEHIDAALGVVDRCGTPWTQASAYRAAAQITGNRRLRRKAAALAALLRS
jgi:tetratricopeptide (TPR) repeat protein